MEETNGVKKNLKIAGISLIVIGLADACYMIYCITHSVRYSSGFNIFAVIAGIFLIRGGLKTASLVAKFSAMFISAVAIIAATYISLMPLDYLSLSLRLHPAVYGSYALFVVLLSAYIIWLYKAMTRPDVLAEMAKAGIIAESFWRKPKSGFALGAILGVVLAGMMFYVHSSPLAERAFQEAGQKAGDGYKLYMSSYSSAGPAFSARIKAYNDKEIKDIDVSWDR